MRIRDTVELTIRRQALNSVLRLAGIFRPRRGWLTWAGLRKPRGPTAALLEAANGFAEREVRRFAQSRRLTRRLAERRSKLSRRRNRGARA